MAGTSPAPGLEHHRLLEGLYHSAPCNEYYAPRLTISEGSAQIKLPVKPEFLHAASAIHGSVYFKILDDAAFFAANSLVPHVWLMTASFELRLMRPVVSGELTASGVVTDFSRHLVLAKAEVRDSGGLLVAKGSGKFARSQVKLGKPVSERS